MAGIVHAAAHPNTWLSGALVQIFAPQTHIQGPFYPHLTPRV
ncbi:MAG TPA: hypothetical protein VGO37_16290 [Steroidobacteraceae bacterium]|nr:hypothetical protein [Steroidobacteraceae bacterium]